MKKKRIINKILDEMFDLNDKMDKLIDFKDSEKFNKLSENQQNLLNTQLYIMMSYMSILKARIEDLKGENNVKSSKC